MKLEKCDSLLQITVQNQNFPQGIPGTDLHTDLVFLDEKGNRTAVLFYSNDLKRFHRGGRARMLLSLFHAPGGQIDFPESVLEVIIKYNLEDAALLICRNHLLSDAAMELAVSLAGKSSQTALLLIFLNYKAGAAFRNSPDNLFIL